MRYLPALLVILALTDGRWDVAFDSHPDNVGLTVVTACSGGEAPYRAVDMFDIDPSHRRVNVRRSGPLPAGSKCTAQFSIIRNSKHDGQASSETVSETALVSFRTDQL